MTAGVNGDRNRDAGSSLSVAVYHLSRRRRQALVVVTYM
jgi:hypothetical protein